MHPNWELIEKIGEGSFGEVYKVFNSSTSSIDVLKVGKKETDSCMRRENDVLREMRSSEGFAKIKTI